MKEIIILVCTFFLSSCVFDNKQLNKIEVTQPQLMKNTRTDTSICSFKNLSYNQICKDLFIHTPNETDLKGLPNSFVENVSQYPNWSKEDYIRISKHSNGKFSVDTTARDFEKYWYNNKGLLEKYEIRDFGDIIHHECLFYYNENDSIKKIEINEIVDINRYKLKTVILGVNTVTFLTHNTVN